MKVSEGMRGAYPGVKLGFPTFIMPGIVSGFPFMSHEFWPILEAVPKEV